MVRTKVPSGSYSTSALVLQSTTSPSAAMKLTGLLSILPVRRSAGGHCLLA